MLVVEGPHGSMPVSNIMQYPLFPGTDGRCRIVPPDNDGDGLPDFLDADPGVPAVGPPPIWMRASDDSLINPAADKTLVALWRRWTYDIMSAPESFRKKTGLIEDKPASR